MIRRSNGIRSMLYYLLPILLVSVIFTNSEISAQPIYNYSFSKVANGALSSVVSIEVTKLVKVRDLGQFHLFRDNDDREDDREEIPRVGGGSGFVVSKDGYILTNHHVVEGAQQLKVTFLNHKVYNAKIIGLDSLTDLALLKVDARNLNPVKFADSDKAEIGDWVLALGSPLGLESTVTAGIVSAKGRDINIVGRDLSANTRGYAIESFIQTDAVINPGNSGGPLINVKGEVVGVNTAIASRTGVYAGYGFAIPSNLAQHIMEDLIAYGEVRRGYIGINIGNVDDDIAEYLGLDGVRGVIVNNFVPGGAAERSDLQIGDVITHVDRKTVNRANELQAVITGYGPNDKVILSVVRRGKIKKIPVTLKARKVNSKRVKNKAESIKNNPPLGLVLENRVQERDSWNPFTASSDGGGISVLKVRRRSSAAAKFIRRGDIIESLNGVPLKSLKDWERTISKVNEGELILLRVKRRNGSNFIALRYWGE